jgi:hypothetical protein
MGIGHHESAFEVLYVHEIGDVVDERMQHFALVLDDRLFGL